MSGLPTYTNDEGVTIVLPYRWEVCDHCEGAGTVSLGGLTITASEWAEWDPEERDDYRSGRYDTPCPECDGRTTVPVVDEALCPPEVVAAAEEERSWWRDEREAREAERRAGC